MTNAFGKDKIYSVIALRKLMKPVVRKAPAGAFRYMQGQKGGRTYEMDMLFSNNFLYELKYEKFNSNLEKSMIK